MHSSRTTHTIVQRQRGAAFIVMLVILIMGVATILVSLLNSTATRIKRDEITASALAQAKEALIGYAASVQIDFTACGAPGNNCSRLGDLPCPDINNDGIAEGSCGNASGSTGQNLRIGRLPWKTLGLPDLRDSSGERLWYAVSNNFKYNTRTTCSSPGLTGCLNSDTMGTISVFTPDGTIMNNGGGSTGAVAVIIAPGDTLKRQDNISQSRGCTLGVDCDVTDKCTSAPPTTVPKCNPQNYLDIATVGGLTEDNSAFADSSSTAGFIQGRIKDANDKVIVNDQLIVVTQDNIMQALQKRVAGEVKQCLNDYAASNGGLYPWAAPTNDPPTYADNSGTWFGRIPDILFSDTQGDNGAMNDTWGVNCNINSGSGWWLNWKEMVFYGFSNTYSPTPTVTPLLTVNPPSTTPNKKFVVIVAGKALTTPAQSRSAPGDKAILSNYLEAPNSTGATGTPPFAQSAPSSTFNDTVVFQ